MLQSGPHSPAQLLDDLNDAQREAVEYSSGPLVLFAGAGTGKTRVISRRAAYAIETGAVAATALPVEERGRAVPPAPFAVLGSPVGLRCPAR